jgi:hypothetical protein
VGILFSQLGAAFTSSFGNLAIENDKNRMFHAFGKTEFIIISIAVVICSGFLACIQDFVVLTFGEKFLLNNYSVSILTLTMLITLINIPIISVQNATGNHIVDVKNMIFQALGAIICGYIGGRLCGMEGILLGMFMPLVVFTTYGKNIIVQRILFDKTSVIVLKNLTITILKSVIIIAIVGFVSRSIETRSPILNVIVKGMASVGISVALLVLTSLKNKYFKSSLQIVRSFFYKKVDASRHCK